MAIVGGSGNALFPSGRWRPGRYVGSLPRPWPKEQRRRRRRRKGKGRDEHDDDRDEQRIERGGVLGGRDDPVERHLDRGRPAGNERELLERGEVVGACDDRERLRVGLHHSDRGVRQSVGDGVGDAAQEAADHHQLFRGLSSVGRHVGRHVRHDVQRERAIDRQMAVRLFHVRRVEFPGRVLQHQLHPPSHVHLGGPLLGDRETAQISHYHDQEAGRLHAARLLDIARVHLVRAHFHGMVHHGREQYAKAESSRDMRV